MNINSIQFVYQLNIKIPINFIKIFSCIFIYKFKIQNTIIKHTTYIWPDKYLYVIYILYYSMIILNINRELIAFGL